jgi:acetyl esterase/lipase
MRILFVLSLVAISFSGTGQQTLNTDSLRKKYFAAQKAAGNWLSSAWYPHRAAIYALSEKDFMLKMDSLKAPFQNALNNYHQTNSDTTFIAAEQRDIDYFFDRMVLDYPYFHHNHTGQKVVLSKTIQKRLDKHRADFNNPILLTSTDIKAYIQSYIRHASSEVVKTQAYKKSDNKRLDACLNLISHYFSNRQCREYWQFYYINNHLENFGSKNTTGIVKHFLSTCRDTTYTKTIDSIYTASVQAGKDHLVKTYKTIGPYNLDMHLFLPESKQTKSPVIVYFSGGSWTEGNPEWAFYTCADYAKKGWVGVSVEYRLADRHETTPFEAVKDARSAIRWLRMNAALYNIDTSRIVVSGNSAGGHLALTTALAVECNENTDDLRYSASPNLLLVNAGVYDLYAEDNTHWILRDLADKNLAKIISPIHALRKGTPPMLIIHGTNDRSVDYATAGTFVTAMEKLGNEVAFHTLQSAPHHIWFDRRFSEQVSALRKEFLKKHGYL